MMLQTNFHSVQRVVWDEYFFSYRTGRAANYPILTYFNLFTTMAGLYFLTPAPERSFIVQLITTAIFFSFSSYAIYFWLKHCRQLIKQLRDKTNLKRIFTSNDYFLLHSIMLCSGALLLFILNRKWVSGKALSYSSPYFALSFIMFLYSRRNFSLMAKATFLIFLLSGPYFGWLRIYKVNHNFSTTPYARPYPANQIEEAKEKYLFDSRAIVARAKSELKCPVVRVNVSDQFVRRFVVFSFVVADIPVYFDDKDPPYFSDWIQNPSATPSSFARVCQVTISKPDLISGRSHFEIE